MSEITNRLLRILGDGFWRRRTSSLNYSFLKLEIILMFFYSRDRYTTHSIQITAPDWLLITSQEKGIDGFLFSSVCSYNRLNYISITR